MVFSAHRWNHSWRQPSRRQSDAVSEKGAARAGQRIGRGLLRRIAECVDGDPGRNCPTLPGRVPV